MADDAASTAVPGNDEAPDSSGDLLQMLEDRLHEVAMEAAGREPEPSPWHLVSPWEALFAQRNSPAQNQERKQEWIDLPQRQQPPAPPASPAADEGDAAPAQAPETDSLQVSPLNPWQDASSGQQPPILPEVPSWDSLMEKVIPMAGTQSTLRNRGWEFDDLMEQYASPPKKEEYVDVNDPKQVADLHSGLEKVLEAMALNMRTEIGHGVEYGAGGAQGYGEANLFADPRNRPTGGGSFYYRSGLIGGHAIAAIQGGLEMIGGGGAALTGGAIDLAGLVPAATVMGIPLSVLLETGGTALGVSGLALAGHGAAVAGNSGRLLWDDLMHGMSDSSPSKDGGQSPGGGEKSPGGGSGKQEEGVGEKAVERPGEGIPRIEVGSSKVNSWTKSERLKMVFDKLSKGPKAKTANEAMQQLHETLDTIEEIHSGAPKVANPGLKSTARVYSAQADSIATASDGSIIAVSRGHIAIYGPKGSITVIDRTTGNVVFQKAGGG